MRIASKRTRHRPRLTGRPSTFALNPLYRVIARDTIEEKVIALARRKTALFSGVMDDGDLFASSLTADDIRGLLG